MKKYLLTLLFLFNLMVCFGQSASPFRQFYFNPYLSNPAYAGINGSTEVYLVYRRQWLNINDAPTTIGASLQYPTKKRVSLGLNIVSDEVVALRNTSVMGTFAYAIPLTSAQTIRFGLSGGAGMNDLNLKEGEYDPNDPVITNAAQNNFYIDGNFGALYTNRGFRLGFAFTQLFDGNRFSSSTFESTKLSSLKNRLYSIAYKFPIGAAIELEPYFLYRERVDKQNSWEAASVVYIKEKLWVGASYHQTNGVGVFFGLNIKDLFKFGYSYELPPVDKTFTAGNSHELQLSLRIGKKREPIAKKPKQNETELAKLEEGNTEPVEEKADVDNTEKESKPATEQTLVGVTPTQTPASESSDSIQTTKEPTKSISKPPRSFALAKGHYVVAGAFKVMQNAIRYSQELTTKGYEDITIAINPKNDLYYVYIFSTYDIDEARKVRNQYRLKRPFSEIWIFSAD